MNLSQIEVQIQSLHQTIVTQVIMMHPVHHHDRISCVTIHVVYIPLLSHFLLRIRHHGIATKVNNILPV